MSIAEAKDEHGNTIFTSFGAWRSAVKTAFPDMWLDGDRDIANAMIGPRPYARGKTISVGEWDGSTGYVNTGVKAPGSQPTGEVEEDTSTQVGGKLYFSANVWTPTGNGESNRCIASIQRAGDQYVIKPEKGSEIPKQVFADGADKYSGDLSINQLYTQIRKTLRKYNFSGIIFHGKKYGDLGEDAVSPRPTSKDYVKGDVVEHTKTELKGIVQGISPEGRLIVKLLGRGGMPMGDTVEWSTGFVRLIKKVQESAGDISGLIKALHAAFSDSIKYSEKDGVYTFTYPTGIAHDASNPHVLSPQNLSKVIDPFFRSFRAAGLTFTQPSGGSFTVSTKPMNEGPYTQHGMDNSPDENTPHNTPWKRDPLAAATDRIHNKVVGALSKFKRSRQPTPGEQLMKNKE